MPSTRPAGYRLWNGRHACRYRPWFPSTSCPTRCIARKTCIRTTLEAAKRCNLALDKIIFEVTEQEQVLDIDHLVGILRAYRQQGFRTAIDDFGAGYAGLNLLADFQPDLLKLDMQLIRSVDQDTVR